MPEILVDQASLTTLSGQLSSLAARTDIARHTAIGSADWDRSAVHDAALGAEIDWFYRRTVQMIQLLYGLMVGEARSVAAARDIYIGTDEAIQRDIDPGPPRRMRRTA